MFVSNTSRFALKRCLDRPVFDLQIVDDSEVPKVRSHQCCIVGDGDGGDFQVHDAEPAVSTSKLGSDLGGGFIEAEDTYSFPRSQVTFESHVGLNLLRRCSSLGQIGHPASRLLFVGDDRRGKRIWIGLFQTLDQSL